MSGSRDPVENANVENILQWEHCLDDLDYFELLGVVPEAHDDELHAAYLRFALTFHPDAHPFCAPRVREALTRIFQRGVEAHQVLAERTTAEQYRRVRALGGRRLLEVGRPVALDLSQHLPRLHEQCRSAGAKLEAQQAAREYARGALEQVERRLLSALRFDGDANPDVERCLVALTTLKDATG